MCVHFADLSLAASETEGRLIFAGSLQVSGKKALLRRATTRQGNGSFRKFCGFLYTRDTTTVRQRQLKVYRLIRYKVLNDVFICYIIFK